jgi:hypothetical protein
MANSFADQLKGLGLRHGEKLGVVIASAVFVLCVGMAATRPTIETTPDQVKKAAQASESNLNRREERDAIVKRLEDVDKITGSNFAQTVEEQTKVQLVADTYKPVREWVMLEPGAGLIRDTPKLIAPTELYAYPGRGGLLVFALDEKGERIPLKEGEEQEKPKQRLGNLRRPRQGGGMGGMMGGMAGQRKRRTKSQADIDREEKAEQARQERLLKQKLTGGDSGASDKAKADEEAQEKEVPSKEITKGYRWVAITGVLDHAQMLANYKEALKNPAIAHPNYKRLDLQRKTLQPDGTWSGWQDVDANKNLDVLDNLPEREEELAPENVLPEGLVDPLPVLKAGLWEKVHIASLVPKEKKEVPKANTGMGGMMGMRSGMGGMGNYGDAGEGGMGGGAMANMMRRMGGSMMMGSGSAGGGMMGGGMERGGMMGASGMMGGGMYGGGGEAVGNYWKSEEKKVMIRALDFTAEPDSTYRYRVRIVVFNPNYNHDDVNPGVDKKSKELRGPWSQETDEVTMPADVTPYAIGTLPPNNPKSDTKVRFQVVRFNPADGVTVPSNFESSAGEIIGDPRTRDIPVADGSGKKSKLIDFGTRQIVLNVAGGGYQQLPKGLVGTPVEKPALAVLLRPDGSVAVHKEADDVLNEVRKDIDSNYHHELNQSNKKRESSLGSGYAGMMMRMMGGSMMGGGGGRGGMSGAVGGGR